MSLFSALGRRALFLLDPEQAHGVSITALKSGLVPACSLKDDPRLSQTVAGLTFANPLGMAAGFDKNADVPEALLRLGFGFAEVGTVTPRPQSGNDKPRIFRLEADEAVINRLGFNNAGHADALAKLKACRRDAMIGVNIGTNKDATDRIADYVAGIALFYDVARYFTVNISSPNTPGLRDLQAKESVNALLTAVLAERDRQAVAMGRTAPVFLKIAPDLSDEGLDDIAEAALERQLDGLIVSNTTLSRAGLKSTVNTGESGGMSGKPLFERSTIVLARMRRKLGEAMPLIGVGGVNSAETAAEKIRAGANLVQLYTGMIYGGPGLPGEIVAGLSRICDREKLGNIAEIRSSRRDYWANKPL